MAAKPTTRKVTANMAPEGGTTYDYANPNYGGPYPPLDGRYTGPDATKRAMANAFEKGLVWQDGNPETNTTGRWVRKEQ